jgi:hypothetical protein
MDPIDKCRACNQECSANGAFCSKCGAALFVQTPAKPEVIFVQVPAKSSGCVGSVFRAALYSLLAIVILGILVSFVETLGRKHEEQGAGKPPVPVVISMRDSAVGEGRVAIFSNQTPNRLTVSVTVENKQFNQRKSVNIDLEPNGNFEFGWLEGWKFVPGETITVSHPNYSSFTERVSK